MICPYCLSDDVTFLATVRDNGLRVHTCPNCNQVVPTMYVEDYDEYPPMIISAVGFRGHGKSVFMHALLNTLRGATVCDVWPSFRTICLDEYSRGTIDGDIANMSGGTLPNATQGSSFPTPLLMQISGIPGVKPFTFVLYDIGGEVFLHADAITQYAFYFARAHTVLFLISPSMLTNPHVEMRQLLEGYVMGMRNLGRQRHTQDIIITYTKGDMLLETLTGRWEPLAQALCTDNNREYANVPAHISRLEAISTLIRDYSVAKLRAPGFISTATDFFRNVKFCMVSALGSDPETVKTMQVAPVPRRVLDPLVFQIASANLVLNQRRCIYCNEPTMSETATICPTCRERYRCVHCGAPAPPDTLVCNKCVKWRCEKCGKPVAKGERRCADCPISPLESLLEGCQRFYTENTLFFWIMLAVAACVMMIVVFLAARPRHVAPVAQQPTNVSAPVVSPATTPATTPTSTPPTIDAMVGSWEGSIDTRAAVMVLQQAGSTRARGTLALDDIRVAVLAEARNDNSVTITETAVLQEPTEGLWALGSYDGTLRGNTFVGTGIDTRGSRLSMRMQHVSTVAPTTTTPPSSSGYRSPATSSAPVPPSSSPSSSATSSTPTFRVSRNRPTPATTPATPRATRIEHTDLVEVLAIAVKLGDPLTGTLMIGRTPQSFMLAVSEFDSGSGHFSGTITWPTKGGAVHACSGELLGTTITLRETGVVTAGSMQSGVTMQLQPRNGVMCGNCSLPNGENGTVSIKLY